MTQLEKIVKDLEAMGAVWKEVSTDKEWFGILRVVGEQTHKIVR